MLFNVHSPAGTENEDPREEREPKNLDVTNLEARTLFLEETTKKVRDHGPLT